MQFLRFKSNDVDVVVKIDRIAPIVLGSMGDVTIMEIKDEHADGSDGSIVGFIKQLPSTLEAQGAFARDHSLDLYVEKADAASVRIAGTLAQPGNLTSGTITANSIVVNWPAVTDATSYKVERADDAGFATNLTTIYEGSLLTFEDTGLTTGTTYYYRVTAKAAHFNNSTPRTGNFATS